MWFATYMIGTRIDVPKYRAAPFGLLLAAEQFCEHVQEIIVRFRLALLPSFEPFGKCAIFLFHLKELLCSHMLSQSKSPVLLLKWPFILSAEEQKRRKDTTSWVHCLALYSG